MVVGDGSSVIGRVRAPLLAAVALIAAVDFIALGTRFADEARLPEFRNRPVAAPRTPTTGVVAAVAAPPEPAFAGPRLASRVLRRGEPARVGFDGGPPLGPVFVNPAPPAVDERPAVPVGQLDIAVPVIGAQVSAGAGENSCTAASLTVIAPGDCPTPPGDGPVVVNTESPALPA